MKNLLLVVCITTLSLNGFSQIKFEKASWEKALLKAKKTNKLIFMDCYTTWCGPCKIMDKNVFTNDSVADFYNKNFINVKMDMESDKGKIIKKKYKINLYPTLLFVDGEGKIIHKAMGGLEAHKFMSLGKTALNPEKRLATFEEKYKSGNRKSDFIYEYLKVLKKINDNDLSKISKEYFSDLSMERLSKEINWKIFCINDKIDFESKEFQYILNNRNLFDSLYTVDSINNVLANIYNSYAKNMFYSRRFDYIEFEVFKREVRKSGLENSNMIVLEADIMYYSKVKRWYDYAMCMVIFLDVYKEKWDDLYYLNNTAYTFYREIDDKILLERAEAWAKRSVKLNNGSFNNDTYAMVLYKLGKKDEALKYGNIALELAIKEGNEWQIKEIEKNIKKIKGE